MLKINPCQITVKDEKSFVSLPERIPKVYSISYKFNKISDTEMVYVRRGQPKSLHAGFLSMNVLILDDKPDKYMNIDRDRLRKGAIDEEELLTVQREIMRRWCIDFCERCEIKQEKGKEGTEYFANIKGTLISLILLFYRNVPDDSFRRFINLYKKIVDSWELFLETDELPVSELWDQENLFQTQVDLPEMVIKGKDMWTEFKDSVMGSEQMKKCVAYIMKKRFADCDDRIEKESAVRKDYERFLKQFYRILMENRELVMNQVEVK